jgi:hypothetical protein
MNRLTDPSRRLPTDPRSRQYYEDLFEIEEAPKQNLSLRELEAREMRRQRGERKEEIRLAKEVSESIKKDILRNVEKDKEFAKNRKSLSLKYRDEAMSKVIKEKNDEAVKSLSKSYALSGGRKYTEASVRQQEDRARKDIKDIVKNIKRERLVGGTGREALLNKGLAGVFSLFG